MIDKSWRDNHPPCGSCSGGATIYGLPTNPDGHRVEWIGGFKDLVLEGPLFSSSHFSAPERAILNVDDMAVVP